MQLFNLFWIKIKECKHLYDSYKASAVCRTDEKGASCLNFYSDSRL